MTIAHQTIGLNSSVQLTPEQSRRVDFILGYPFDFLEKRLIQRKRLSDRKARQLTFEFRRFMVIACLRGAPLAAPNGAVDEMWHEFLMFTKKYRDFCQDGIGEFVDH